MKSNTILLSFVLAVAVLTAQISPAAAASTAITGTVQRITLEADADTAVTTVVVTILENEAQQTVRISIETAIALGLVMLNGDGNPVINDTILGQPVEIDSATVIIEEQLNQHPVGSAMAAFFADIADLDYETIMAAYEQGAGFGVIAQALWLTRKMEGDAAVFVAIIEAKKNNDFSDFILPDGTTAENWGQFKKAVLVGGKDNLGVVMKSKNNNGVGNGNSQNNGNNGKGKDKNKDKPKNGSGNGSKP